MENIMVTNPLELMHIDYLCLKPGKGKEENVLVGMDHFTHYTQAYVTQSQTAQTMTKAFGTISSSTIDYQRKSFRTREGILRESS